MRNLLTGLALAALLWSGETTARAAEFTLSSTSFKDGEMLKRMYAGKFPQRPDMACLGDNVSPAFSWANPPAGTRSYALMMVDTEGLLGLGVNHWVAYGIPVSVTGLAEGEASQPSPKFVGGRSTQGILTYMGPCTPVGGQHHYSFTLVATDLDPTFLPVGLTREELLVRLKGHALGAVALVARFVHP